MREEGECEIDGNRSVVRGLFLANIAKNMHGLWQQILSFCREQNDQTFSVCALAGENSWRKKNIFFLFPALFSKGCHSSHSLL